MTSSTYTCVPRPLGGAVTERCFLPGGLSPELCRGPEAAPDDFHMGTPIGSISHSPPSSRRTHHRIRDRQTEPRTLSPVIAPLEPVERTALSSIGIQAPAVLDDQAHRAPTGGHYDAHPASLARIAGPRCQPARRTAGRPSPGGLRSECHRSVAPRRKLNPAGLGHGQGTVAYTRQRAWAGRRARHWGWAGSSQNEPGREGPRRCGEGVCPQFRSS